MTWRHDGFGFMRFNVIVILDLQVFRKFFQIQGGKKFCPQEYMRYFEDQNFFPTPELGKLTKT
jgi:hypothetical protein